MSKVLVVYFSRSGGTELLAQRIAHAGEWDCEAIRDHEQRGGIRGYLRSGWEATRRRPVDIDPLAHRLEDYDLVVIGTPTWNYSVSSPVRAFLERHRDRLARVAFFVSCGGNPGRTLAQMTELARQEPVATLVARRRDLKAGPFAMIEQLVLSIERELRAHPAPAMQRPPAHASPTAP